jgi:hypothetical protein
MVVNHAQYASYRSAEILVDGMSSELMCQYSSNRVERLANKYNRTGQKINAFTS